MKKQLSLLLATLFFSVVSHAGYQCSALLDDDGNLGHVVVTLDFLDRDPEVLQTLRDIFYFEDATFVKYQYWIDAGQDFHMVHFIGVSNELNRDGAPEIVTKNLFCKDDGFTEEPFF